MRDQFLDKMDLERERGITIKAQTVRMRLPRPRTAQDYVLNLIDTPGHVDFSLRGVARAAACEGAVLVVDASQGIEAQTLANAYLAVDDEPRRSSRSSNKIDLPSADLDARARRRSRTSIGLDATSVLPVVGEGRRRASARSSSAIVARGAAARRRSRTRRSARSIFDAWFDSVRRRGDARARRRRHVSRRASASSLMASGSEREVDRRSTSSIRTRGASTTLAAGEVGIVVAGIKTLDRGAASATR